MSGDEERIEVPRSPLRVPAGLAIEHVDPPARPQGAYRDEARRERRTLVMTLRDRSPFPWLLVVFAVSWNLLIAAFWLAPLGFRDAGLPTSLTLAMFTAIGLGLACVAIAVFTNRTVIRVAGDEIDVRRGPLPVWRQRAPVSTVRLTELRVRHRRRPSPEGVVETWDVARRDPRSRSRGDRLVPPRWRPSARHRARAPRSPRHRGQARAQMRGGRRCPRAAPGVRPTPTPPGERDDHWMHRIV